MIISIRGKPVSCLFQSKASYRYCEVHYTGDMLNICHMSTRVLEPAEYPGFGHPQNRRVSTQSRTRHGCCPVGLHPPGIQVSINRGTPQQQRDDSTQPRTNSTNPMTHATTYAPTTWYNSAQYSSIAVGQYNLTYVRSTITRGFSSFSRPPACSFFLFTENHSKVEQILLMHIVTSSGATSTSTTSQATVKHEHTRPTTAGTNQALKTRGALTTRTPRFSFAKDR